jgi:sRNA-binding regulator protein Hfq
MPRPKPIAEIPATGGASETVVNGEFSGQRRLVRPSMSVRALSSRQSALYGHGPALTSRSVASNGSQQDSSHAEVFYFQKQIQAQTRMVVVLENGHQLQGIVEWYDRYAIKLRNVGNGQENHGVGRHRVLVYKDSIRYIYKAEDNAPQTMT